MQDEVDGVVGQMKDTLGKVLERDEKLATLETKSDALSANAKGFNTTSRRLKRRMWWRDKRWAVAVAVLTAIIVAVVVVVLV